MWSLSMTGMECIVITKCYQKFLDLDAENILPRKKFQAEEWMKIAGLWNQNKYNNQYVEISEYILNK